MAQNKYKYPNSNKIFVLKCFNENGTAFFKCGHWFTDNVFNNLINIKTGIPNWKKSQQLSLFD